MEIIKIIGIAFIALIIIIMLKQYRPEYAIFISILTGILILFLVMDRLTGIINLIETIQDKFSINTQFIALLIKITGIAFLSGMMIIPAVFAFSGGTPETLQAGPSLMFITIPKVSNAVIAYTRDKEGITLTRKI